MTDQSHRVTWFHPSPPDRPVENTFYERPQHSLVDAGNATDVGSEQQPHLRRVARLMLDSCIRDACGEDPVHLPGWVAEEVRAGFDAWRTRALSAEARVDGQAWADLEAERDRLRVELADAQALIDAREDEVNSVRMQAGAALSSSEAPTPPAPWDQTVAHPAAWRAAHHAGVRAYRGYDAADAAIAGCVAAAVATYMETVQRFADREHAAETQP